MKIQTSVIWQGRSGKDKSYFHPRATPVKNASDQYLLMTLQEMTGSDYFHQVEFSVSRDNGNTWSTPSFIPSLGRTDIGGGISEGVCDVVPDYHPQTGSVLAMGHNVYYKNNKLYDSLGDFRPENGPSLQRYITYTVYGSDGWTGQRKRLHAEGFEECSMFSCGCSQKVILPDGKLIIPVTFGFFGRKDRMVSSLLCDFDGKKVSVLKKGSVLELPVKRGLLEPSAVLYKGRYHMTIRAEDGNAYVTSSGDGLAWAPIKPWNFDDGSEFITSTTQQHWLLNSNKLYLVYVRKLDYNINVMRWRTPLLISEVDTSKMELVKASEKVLLPLDGDGVNDPNNVPIYGNFHVTHLSDSEAIVTEGSTLPKKGFKGDTFLARISG